MLRKWYHKLFENKRTQPIRKRPRAQLRLEVLEDRAVPASFTVTSTADDGSAGTLRYAISQANASSDATNTIDFNLPSGPQTIVLTQGTLALTNSHSTIIQGTGASQLFISGNHASGVFSIDSGTTVELDDLTIEDGSNSLGGGINNSGNLTIDNSTLSENSANIGGGIYNGLNATVAINNSTLSGNTANLSGGGIDNDFYATAIISNSTLSGNMAAHNGGGMFIKSSTAAISNSTISGNSADYGGGVFNSTGTTTISNSILSGNKANFYGGGIYSNAATASMSSSTLSGNTAADAGGGIYSFGYSYAHATATFDNSTISGNTTTNVGGGIFNAGYVTAAIDNSTISGNTATYNGGGVYNSSATPTKLGNSIVAENTSKNGPDVNGEFNSLGYNLIGNTSDSIGFSAANHDILNSSSTGIDPNGLQNNGGPLVGATGSQQVLQTIALLPGSLAIDAGNNALIPIDPSTGQPYATDQRGPGYARIFGSSVDIGAYEAQQQAQTLAFNPLPNRMYGDSDFGLTATASSGLPVSYTAAGNATVYQDTSGNWFAHITGAGTATITASQAGNSSYAAAPSVSQTFTISPLAVALTGSRTYDGTTTAAANILAVSNEVSGDNVTLSGNALLASANAADENITSFAELSLGGSSASNYTLTTATGSVNITPAPISHAIGNDSQTYGSPANLAADLPSTIASGINSETLDISYASTGDTATADAGTYAITGTLSDGNGLLSNYTVTLTNGTLTVNKADLTVTADNASKVYGQDDSAALTGTITGIQNNDPVTAGYASLGSSVTAVPGTYAVDAVLSDNNTGKLALDYTVTMLKGVLTVLKDSTTTTITSSANPSDYGNAVTFTATVTANAPGSGTPTGMVAFYDGSTLLGAGTLSGGVATFTTSGTLLASGTHSITAQYEGDGDFLAGTSAVLTQSVLSAQQQIALMANQVNGLETSGVLNSGNGNALAGKLNHAIASLNSGNVAAGVNQLNAFINQVSAFLHAGKLSQAQAESLIDAANQAIFSAQA